MSPLIKKINGTTPAIRFGVLLMFLIGVFCASYAASEKAAAPNIVPPPPARSKWDDHIDELEKQAIDDAFKKHIAQLYSIWVTDNYQPKIPPKALAGARNARDAYIRSMESIEQREQIPRR